MAALRKLLFLLLPGLLCCTRAFCQDFYFFKRVWDTSQQAKSPVHEGKKNFYCSNRECAFTMWKNDRFFEERKVTFTPKIAAALLKSGKANVEGLYSPKTGKTYDGTVVLTDTGGKYVNYKIEIPKKK